MIKAVGETAWEVLFWAHASVIDGIVIVCRGLNAWCAFFVTIYAVRSSQDDA
jgi:hypothetical protein